MIELSIGWLGFEDSIFGVLKICCKLQTQVIAIFAFINMAEQEYQLQYQYTIVFSTKWKEFGINWEFVYVQNSEAWLYKKYLQ